MPRTLDCIDACPDDVANDSDDLCPGSDDALDADGDTLPDACDACPADAAGDSDGDGSCDSVDVCPGSDDEVDADHNGVPDGCQECVVDADCRDGNACTADTCVGAICVNTTTVDAECGVQGKCNAAAQCVNEGCQLIPLGDLPGGIFESDVRCL